MELEELKQNINIINWNCNGINNKINELHQFLEIHKIDIAIITELRGIINRKINIRGYRTIKKQSKENRGGVAVLIKNGISFTEIITPEISPEIVSIKIEGDILICGVYNSPQNLMTKEEWMEILKSGNKVLIGGDFNARHSYWNNSRSNKNGKTLQEVSELLDIHIWHPENHTHFPLNGMSPTTIDIFISKNIKNIANIESINDLSSDHIPVLLQLNDQIPESVNILKPNYKKANWKKFREIITEKLIITPRLLSNDEIDIETDKITNLIQTAMEKSIPNQIVNNRKLQIPDNIKQLITDRNKCRKYWQKTRNIDWKNRMIILNKDIQIQMKEHKNNIWKTKLENLNVRNNSIWRMNKNLKTQSTVINALEKDGDLKFNIKEKINIMTNHIKQVHCIEQNNNDQEKIEQNVTSWLKNNQIDIDNMEFITNSNEIKNTIKNTNSAKAPGEDGILYKILKNLPTKAIAQLIYIFNSVIRRGYFPTKWKNAEIIFLLKPGKPNEKPESYRPISLLNTLSRIMEKLISKRLDHYVTEYNILPNTQFGFRNAHNTEQQLNRICTDVINGFKEKKITAMQLIDIEKAYDRVWIKGLIHKLIEYKIPNNLIILINSYLESRKFRVKMENTKGEYEGMSNGLPQGSALSPKLFNLYIADMPEWPNTKLATFADDTAIYARSDIAIIANRKLNMYNRCLEDYYRKWKIKVNNDKIKSIIFSKNPSKNNIPIRNQFNSVDIELSDTIKYLGIMLHKTMSYKYHIEYVIKKAYILIRRLYPLLAKDSAMYTENKLRIYKVVIRPLLTYGCSVWQNCGSSNILKLQRLQNKCLRLALNKDRYTKIDDLHEESGIERIDDHMCKLSEKFFNKTVLSDNPLIKNITKIRVNEDKKHKYKLPYANLNIYQTVNNV